MRNILSHIPDHLPEELFTTLHQRGTIKIERIVSNGHASPPGFWYDQPQDEWVLLISGSATLAIEKNKGTDTVHLNPGDYLHLPAHCKHRVEATSKEEKTIWLALFSETDNNCE